MATENLAVLVAPRGLAVALIDMLADWRASEFIDQVIVIDEDALRADDFRIPSHVVTQGGTTGHALQSYIADLVGVRTIRVCAVGTVRKVAMSPSPAASAKVVDVLQTTLPQATLVKAQVIGATLQGAKLPSDFAWLGWHNIVVAPEDSMAPGSGVARLSSDEHRGLLDAHLLTSLCTLIGAWADTDGSPLDDAPMLPGTQVTLFRSYSRLLAATHVEDELLARLASVDGGYPLPMVGNEQAWHVENEQAAVKEMADQLLTKHDYVLPGERSVPRRRSAKRIGALEALKHLLGFLWAALKNAPRAWVDAVLASAAAGVAGTVGRTVFGSGDSEYEVVVRGVRADGTPASWADIDEQVSQVTSRLGPVANSQASSADLSGLWRDFVGGAMTLLDGEARISEMPAVAVGSHRGIIGDASLVVPPVESVFEPSGPVAANIQGWRVEPADLIQARQLDAELERVGNDNPMLRTQAVDDQARLREWVRTRERTYSGRVGFRLGGALVQTRQEIADLAAKIAEANRAVELPDDIGKTQQAMATKLRWMLFGAVLAVVVVALVLLLNVVGVVIAAALVVAIIVLWFGSSLLVFMNGQRRLFALIHERQDLVSRLAVMNEHLAAAIGDLRRLIRAYRQYLDWARVLGVFVAAPSGQPQERGRGTIALGAGLPRCIEFGEVQPQPQVVDEVAARLRNDLFKTGWLSASWKAFVADLPEELGTRAYEVRENTQALWVDQGPSDRSLLIAWSRAVADRGIGSAGTEELRARMREALASHPSGLVAQLSSTIQVRNTAGSPERVDYQQFMAGVLDHAAGQHVFDQSVFTDLGAQGEPWIVASTWSGSGSEQLGGSVVVAQRSRGVASTDLGICVPSSGHEPARVESPDATSFPTM